MKLFKNGILKTSKMFNIGAHVAFAGACTFMLGYLGLFSLLFSTIPEQNGYNKFLDEVRATEEYQEYFQQEKKELDDKFTSNEITSKEYSVEYEELNDNAVQSYISEHGTDEQKDTKNKHDELNSSGNTAGWALGGVTTGLGTLTTCAGAAVMYKGYRKESEYDKKTKEMAEIFGADEVELPNIEDEEYEVK